MQYTGDLVEGRFVHRPNRFVAHCEVPEDGEEEARCFCPNPGRLHEFRTPGRRVLLERAPPGTDRSTDYKLLAFHYNDRWVSVDTHLPNKLVAQALEEGRIEPFAAYPEVRAEVPYGDSRLDFLLSSPDGDVPDHLVEVKSVTLVVPRDVYGTPDFDPAATYEGFRDGLGLFPDAVTTRGARHVRELTSALDDGFDASVLWILQRDDANTVMPCPETDPDFAQACREARDAGVAFHAVSARCTRKGVELAGPVDVRIP